MVEEIYIDGCSRFPKRKLVGDIIVEHNKVSKKDRESTFW